MNPARREHIITALQRLQLAEEVEAFRKQLSTQGEMADSEVFRAVSRRGDQINGRMT